MEINPYISFVTVARNDNYGGDFLDRINHFVENIIVLSERYKLPAELLIVEWNPPLDKSRLRDAISWPSIQRRYIDVKIVEVPNYIHLQMLNPENLFLFEYIGKNVGVKRAKGEYILTTNPDTLFNHNLMEFLAAQNLHKDSFYRIDRYDVKKPVPYSTTDNKLDYCMKNVIKVNGYYWSSFNPGTSGKYWRCKQLKAFALYSIKRASLFPFVPPHVNASGDFLLMHRSQWDKIRGFPEFETQGKPHHIDNLIIRNVLFSGLKQVILKDPLRLYHIDHGRIEPTKPRSLVVHNAFEQLNNKREFIIFNDEWGLQDFDLPFTNLQEHVLMK